MVRLNILGSTSSGFGPPRTPVSSAAIAATSASVRVKEKRSGWRPAIARALAERADSARPTTLGPLVRATAAVECLNIAVNHWTASDGRLDLDALLDEAFAALAPR
jgi:hypothetical protein